MVVLVAIWAATGTIFAAYFYDGWFGWLVSLPWFLAQVALGFLGLIAGPASLVFITIAGIRRARATGAGWLAIVAWAGFAGTGAGLEIALWQGVGYWPDGYPRPAWETMLWAGFAIVGIAAIVVIARPWRFRPSARSFCRAWRSAPAACLTCAGALLVLAVCVPGFAGAELANVRSVHSVQAGKETSLWLGRGVYDIDQDPGSGAYPEVPSAFSVVGAQGMVAVTRLPGKAPVAELGVAFLNTAGFAPADTFEIKTPGRYRVSLHAEPDLWVVLVSDDYGTVLTRTAPWVAGIWAALVVMAGCLIRLRAVRRPQAPTGKPALR